MQYRTIGQTGLRVSEIGFGCGNNAALMVKATTVPSLMCQSSGTLNMADVVLTGQVIRAQTSGSALTATAPGTIASPTTAFRVPYVVLS